MSQEVKHTPTPWFVDDEGDISMRTEVLSEMIATTYRPMREANATFIVRCVNSHEALVNALQEIADGHVPDLPAGSHYEDDTWARAWVGRLRRIAEDALKLARGE